ncbi:phosphopantetheine-binding protein [Mycoplasma sp. Ms02]|uniref:phosphopantetheine-binding protein n=1 Tax=Mycoplasma sp. Ms02 TaxID=353851 RepID=UPI001C894F50|nr:phosphopantetheine-binding protein [Mycoplasma sp. Ms02]QZE12054.1 acyl carrier protein [Mycoplasma sp. Ms02]
MNLEQKILDRISKVARKEVSLHDTFDSLNIDSLDLAELVMEAEDELGITVPDEELMKIKSVQDLVETLNRLV